MSIHVMDFVWKYSRAAGGDLLMLLAIADFSHEDGTGAFPSIETLANKTRVNRRTAQRILRKLEKLGELRTIPGGGHRSNGYEILLDREGRQIAAGGVYAASKAVSAPPYPSSTVSTLSLNLSLEDSKTVAAGRVPESVVRRLCDVVHRKHTTRWSDAETTALRKLGAIDDDELCMVERYYAAERKRKDNHLRTSILTLLRHWPTEVDRARGWCEKNPLRAARTLKAKPTPRPEPSPLDSAPVDRASVVLSRSFLEQFERSNGRLPWGWSRNGDGEFEFNGAPKKGE